MKIIPTHFVTIQYIITVHKKRDDRPVFNVMYSLCIKAYKLRLIFNKIDYIF